MTIKSQLYPDVDQRAGAGPLSSSLSPLVGVVAVPRGVPAVAVTSPTAAATSSKCAWVTGCPRAATDRLTGFCESHAEFWADEVREHTDSIGRGDL